MAAVRCTITTEIYQAATWSAPEGGPEVDITFDYRPPSPLRAQSVEFVSARYTHDGSALTDTWLEWARDWLADHESEAADRAWPKALAASIAEQP